MGTRKKSKKDLVVQTGDPVLRAKAKPLTRKDIGSRALNALIAKMKKTLKGEEFGVAIAAPQVGASVRLFVIAGRAFLPESPKEEGTGEKPKKETKTPPDMVFINPEILRTSKKKREMAEGCLSVRGTYGTVMRAEKASVRAQDEHGKLFTYHSSGLIAHIFQHEYDHLDGILYTDKAVKLEGEEKRDTLRKAYSPGDKQRR